MICFLLSFLLLDVCFSSVVDRRINGDEYSHYLSSAGESSSSDTQLSGRIYGDVKGQKTLETSVIFCNLPSFSNFTVVGDVESYTDKFYILYKNVKFYQLSSAYALGYQMDLDKNKVKLCLDLGKAQIKGGYCISTMFKSSDANTTLHPPTTAAQDFEVNLYANLLYGQDVSFKFENGKVIFGKAEKPRLLYDRVKGKYANPPAEVAADLENYLNPKLLDTVVAKIYDEVHQKVNLDDVGYQIKNEIALKRRYEIGQRLEKAVLGAFEKVRKTRFNVFHLDYINFHKTILNYDVTIPSYIIRDIEGYKVDDVQLSYVNEEVHMKVVFVISSPLVVCKILYRNKDDPHAEDKVLKAEYRIHGVNQGLEVIAKSDIASVEFGSVFNSVDSVEIAATQAPYGDERDVIMERLLPHLKSYFTSNTYYPFCFYSKGLLAEGQISYNTFGDV